jgi:3-deoxy-D-manno-octulosonic-acid transferase
MRRSTPDSSRLLTPVDTYLLDSIGELASVYRGASLAFVGGSLIARGGQNPIEAWAAGVPVLAGPHMENFRDVAAAGQERGILTRVENVAGLARELTAALGAPEETRRRAADAERFVEENRGAADRTAEAILALLPDPAAKGLRA